MNALYRLPLVLVLMLAAVPARAQPPDVNFERLEGLTHNTVLSLLQDRQGFLWIGTAGGLHRYDGYEIAVYRHDPRDPSTLANNSIYALLEDRGGTLWIGTGDGLHHLDRSSQRFIRHPAPAGFSDRPFRIAALEEDESGRLWVDSFAGRIYRYEPRAHQWTPYPDTLAPAGSQFGNTSVDSVGRIWAVSFSGSGNTVHRYDPEGDRLRPHPTRQRVSLLHAGRSGLWAIGQDVIRRFDDAESGPAFPLQLPTGERPRRVLEDRRGRLWIGTEDGILLFDPRSGQLQRYRMEAAGTSGLSDYVWTLYEDRAGLIWVGTRSGLFRYDPHRKPFVHLGPGAGWPVQATNTTVMALHQDASGRLWIGTLGGGLLYYDPTRREVVAPQVVLPDERVWALQAARNGSLWVGTEKGLCMLAPDALQCVPAPRPPGEPFVYVIEEAHDGTLWIGGDDLYHYDPRSAIWTARNVIDGLEHTPIQALHVMADATLWIGTENAGMLHYDPTNGVTTHYPYGSANPEGLPGTDVWVLHEDRRGRLWLGTDLGLVRFESASGTFHAYSDPEAPSSASVYSILEGPEGSLWLGTNSGLARFDPSESSFRTFGADFGNLEFNRRAAFRHRNGAMFFGSLNGLAFFQPAAIRDNPNVPPVAITDVQIFGREGTRTLSPPTSGLLQLGHHDAAFEFSFVALSFTQPEHNRYAYRLEGFDGDWMDAGTDRRARYTNVPPGDYTFRVVAANSDGVWNEQGVALPVRIAPAFWQTWWFRLLLAGALATGLAAAYRYRVAHLLAMERLRLRIASDLHDDVGSKLGSIALMSEMVSDRPGRPDAERDELSRIGTVARQVAESLRDIVWFVDPEHDAPGELRWRMKNEAAMLLNGARLSFDVPDPLALEEANVAVRRNVFLIYKEALHNAARHAHASTLSVRIDEHGDHLELVIADDGVGFDVDEVTHGHGLRNMQRRAKQIGAEISIESAGEEGTRVRLRAEIT